jgi:hypothetical protein
MHKILVARDETGVILVGADPTRLSYTELEPEEAIGLAFRLAKAAREIQKLAKLRETLSQLEAKQPCYHVKLQQRNVLEGLSDDEGIAESINRMS